MIKHKPAPTRVTVVPETVQIELKLVVLKLTVNPLDAVALTVKVSVPEDFVRFVSVPNVIDCGILPTVTVKVSEIFDL